MTSQKKKNMHLTACAVAVAIIALDVQQTVAQGKASLEIPAGTVQTNSFLNDLSKACEALAGAGSFSAEGVWDELSTKGNGDRERLQQLIRKLAKTKTITDSPSMANSYRYIDWVASLRGTCVSLAGTADLADDDLQRLRAARDTPDVLTVAARFGEALSTSETRDAKTVGSALMTALQVPPPSAGASVAAASGLTGLSDTVIRGRAGSLAERDDREALSYLHDGLEERLHDKEINRFFPNTCAALQAIGEAISLESIGAYLGSAAEEDLRELPDHTLAFLRDKSKSSTATAYAGQIGLALFRAAANGRVPFEILRDAGLISPDECEDVSIEKGGCQEIAHSLRLAAAFAYALQQGEPEDWPGFYQRLADQNERLIFVALMLLVERRFEELAATDRRLGSFWRISDTQRVVARAASSSHRQLWSIARRMHARWSALAEALGRSAYAGEARSCIASTLVQSVASTTSLAEQAYLLMSADGNRKPIPENVRQPLNIMRAMGEVAVNVWLRDHGAATVKLLAELRKSDISNRVPNKIGALLPLMVELAQAQSSH